MNSGTSHQAYMCRYHTSFKILAKPFLLQHIQFLLRFLELLKFLLNASCLAPV
ncbi:hypothetical protein PAHAL_3G344100 [Panicum hallii]|uniref:Uncharacterized protein n=1 Tax=Panicum hallii TaxID=206008 RepID=A0A2T8KKD2_9POAL|nr:hypothetical protein PAHAL_3G344100 [Panicum hallii]